MEATQRRRGEKWGQKVDFLNPCEIYMKDQPNVWIFQVQHMCQHLIYFWQRGLSSASLELFSSLKLKKKGIGQQQPNKAFIDIRLRPSITLQHGLLQPNVTSPTKPKVHNVSQRHHRRTEPRLQGICTPNMVKIGPALPGICSQTDRQTHTDRRVDHNTPHPYRGGVITVHLTWVQYRPHGGVAGRWDDVVVIILQTQYRAGVTFQYLLTLQRLSVPDLRHPKNITYSHSLKPD